MESREIEIEISGGVLVAVNGLPEGWTYSFIDHDDEKETNVLDKEHTVSDSFLDRIADEVTPEQDC